MLCRVALVRTDVSEELSASFIRVARIGELGTTPAVTSNRCRVCRLLFTASAVPTSPILVTLIKEALSSSETSVLTRATWRNIQEDAILQLEDKLLRRGVWSKYFCSCERDQISSQSNAFGDTLPSCDLYSLHTFNYIDVFNMLKTNHLKIRNLMAPLEIHIRTIQMLLNSDNYIHFTSAPHTVNRDII
jgi:hypothetical protein